MNEPAKKYAFVLGREQEICLEELKSVFDRFCFCLDIFRISGNVVFAKVENFSADDAREIIKILGGTIKIYELTGSLANNISLQVCDLIAKLCACHSEQSEESRDGIPHQVRDNFSTLRSGKINFGISCFNKKFTRQLINAFALGAKKKLKGKISLRFVEAKDGLELSSIQTLKNNLADKGIEFGIFDEEMGVLVALNNPEEWNNRDYDKPAFDKYSGMVPPKLARMMVNMALGQIGITNNELRIMDDKTVLNHDSKFMIHNSERPSVVDPFCGSGNILMEAIMLGCDVVGSDNSLKAVNDTRANIEWLLSKYQISDIKYQISQSDATNYDFQELAIGDKQLVVVCEPYLGEPKKFKTSFNATVGEYKKIFDLYMGFLENIAKLLNCPIAEGTEFVPTADNNITIQQFNSCVLCLIFPLVETTDQGQFSLYKECVDEIKNLGYTQVRPTMTYGRDYQVVKREIVQLKLERNK